LIAYARNPRKNDAAVDLMCGSLKTFGFKIPCLVRSDGEVIDGHLRLKAARKLGIAEIPVVLCDEWTPAQVRAFRLMVNRSATWAEWDEDLLRVELLDLETSNSEVRADAPVAMINETLANEFGGPTAVLGHDLRFGR
jgi:ParB-like chromosome segregation protein Spo0J